MKIKFESEEYELRTQAEPTGDNKWIAEAVKGGKKYQVIWEEKEHDDYSDEDYLVYLAYNADNACEWEKPISVEEIK